MVARRDFDCDQRATIARENTEQSRVRSRSSERRERANCLLRCEMFSGAFGVVGHDWRKSTLNDLSCEESLFIQPKRDHLLMRRGEA